MSVPNYSRGGFAPRRGRGGNRSFTKQREPPKLDIRKHPLGELLQTFRNADLEVPNLIVPDESFISDCQYVASYNWLDDELPTIIVPGKPPRWTPVQTAQRLQEDSGQYFRDPNAAKYPEYPMAPIVHAILDSNSSFDTASINLFACGSTFGNLLRFVRGDNKVFRFNIEVIGNTVFFVRKENDPRELIKDVRGFGHSFPEAYTAWDADVKGSETHQRIVQYNFAGFKCLVHFECDGYLGDVSKGRDTLEKRGASDENDLLHALSTTTIARPVVTTQASNKSLNIQRRGSETPQHSIFDLKTRSGKHSKKIDMSDLYPLLWLKQIPNFIVAYHDGAGLFRDIKVKDVRADVQKWENDNANSIRRLSDLLKKITQIAKGEEGGLLEAVSQHADTLEIRRQHDNGAHALPADLRDDWADGSGGLSLAVDVVSDNDVVGGAAEDDSYKHLANLSSDDDEPDYTACSAHDCGYCGKCTY